MAKKISINKVDKGSYRSNIALNEKELPQVKDWKVGEKYQLVIEVEMTGLQKISDYSAMKAPEISSSYAPAARQEPPKLLQGEFKVLGVGVEEAD